MESKTGLMSRDSSEGLDAKELASLSEVREEAIATQAATEPEPKPEPETKHHLSNVPFTQWPLGASPSDRQVGQDDAGNPLFEMQFSKNTYIVKRDPDQRTPRKKLKDAVVTGQKAVTNYLQGDDHIPSASEVAEFGKAIAVTAYETLEGAMSGEGTYGDVFDMAPTMAVAGMGFKVPKGALRTFGGKGMDLDDDQTSRFADARSKFTEALNTVDVNDPAAFYDLNKKIWKETGWFINPKDRQWRYEIDDKQSVVSFADIAANKNLTTSEVIDNFRTNSSLIKLPELFKHDKLFERYPHLKDMDVLFYESNTGELGSQSPGQNKININTAVLDIRSMPQLQSTILHEIQHAIQDYEGFSIGANNDFIPDEVTEALVDKQTMMRFDLTKERVSILTRVKPRLKEFFKNLPEDRRPDFTATLDKVFNLVSKYNVSPQEINKKLEAVTKTFIKNNGIREYTPLSDELLKLSKNLGEDYAAQYLTKDMEFKFYRGAGGEIESRLVQARAKYLRGGKNPDQVFPLDHEEAMLKVEGSSPEYEGKVDKAGDALYRVRSPKLGESDVYVDPIEDRDAIKQRVYKEEGKDPNKFDADVIEKTDQIYVRNILKGYPELEKVFNLKEYDKVMLDGNEYTFKNYSISRDSKHQLPETGLIMFKPKAKGQLLRDVMVPKLFLVATDSSLPAKQRFKTISLTEFLQKTDLIDEPFDIQKLSEPPKPNGKKSILGQMKSLFGYDEGGLTTSLRPFTREDSIKESNKRENELKQLGNLEFRADLDKQLSWNPLARLGYQPDKTKVLKTDSPSFYGAYHSMVLNPDGTDKGLQDRAIGMGFPKEEAKRLKAGDVFVTSDSAFNPVYSHEYTHIGLEKVFKLAKKNPKVFKEKYGEDAYGLIATSTEDYIRDEYLTELFDDLTTKFNSLGLGDSLKVSDKFPNKSIAFTTGSDRYDDKFIDTRKLFQESIKNKDTKTTKEDVTTFNENLKGIFGIMDAAQDILTEQGEPPKAKRKEKELSFYEQFKKALGFNEGGLSTKRKNELKQLGNLEYTADFQEALGDDYIARLGFDPNVVKIAYDDSTINPFYNPTGSDKRYKLNNKIIFPDEIGINTGAASDKPIAVHEFRHRGFQMLVDKFKSPDNLKKFKNTYGSEAANLLMKIKADGGDYFSAQFVGPYAEFTNEILDASVLQDNKRGNRPADQTIMGVNYKKGSPFTTKEGLTEINAQTIFDFQNYLKDPTTLTDPESRNLHTNKDINNIINKEMNKGQIFKGLAGIQKAAKDLLESLPFKTSRKTVSGRTIWRDPKTKEDYSERTTTFQIGNRFYTMPTVAEDGSQYSDDVMRDYVEKYGPIDFITGEELPTFATEKEAVMYAIERSDTRKGTEQ